MKALVESYGAVEPLKRLHIFFMCAGLLIIQGVAMARDEVDEMHEKL